LNLQNLEVIIGQLDVKNCKKFGKILVKPGKIWHKKKTMKARKTVCRASWSFSKKGLMLRKRRLCSGRACSALS